MILFHERFGIKAQDIFHACLCFHKIQINFNRTIQSKRGNGNTEETLGTCMLCQNIVFFFRVTVLSAINKLNLLISGKPINILAGNVLRIPRYKQIAPAFYIAQYCLLFVHVNS